MKICRVNPAQSNFRCQPTTLLQVADNTRYYRNHPDTATIFAGNFEFPGRYGLRETSGLVGIEIQIDPKKDPPAGAVRKILAAQPAVALVRRSTRSGLQAVVRYGDAQILAIDPAELAAFHQAYRENPAQRPLLIRQQRNVAAILEQAQAEHQERCRQARDWLVKLAKIQAEPETMHAVDIARQLADSMDSDVYCNTESQRMNAGGAPEPNGPHAVGQQMGINLRA